VVCAPPSAVVCDTCDTARVRRRLANRAPRGRQHGDQPTHEPLGIFEVNGGSVRQFPHYPAFFFIFNSDSSFFRIDARFECCFVKKF
jgi:hypothetical protein